RIDLNSDLGEGAGTDEEIMPSITSANVACGAHAGDEATMRRTIALAKEHGVAIGAHPGYRDAANFGRVALELTREELLSDLRTQLEAIQAVADVAGVRLVHVKAHGALYNRGERDDAIAAVVAEAVRAFDEDLVLYAPPGSAMERAARTIGLRVAREGFADRAYEPDGTLRSRTLPASVHADPAVAARQAVSIARDRRVTASDGSTLVLEVDTLCIHGDTPGAAAIARAVRAALAFAGIDVRAAAAR
ncbi:MAG: LamB/YcsF family protein, partial [Chloroflexota bacterium]|nr:LamB/YcsF family protein [Chloroflexota bacterium]